VKKLSDNTDENIRDIGIAYLWSLRYLLRKAELFGLM